MKIVAIMPLKLNNERLPYKNTMLLNGKPLLLYSLEKMKDSNMCDEIYVYCSNENIESLLPVGVKYLCRDKSLDLPTSNFNQIFESFMKKVDADIYVYFHATSPFVSIESICDCIEMVKSNKYDSAFCATKIQDFLWKENKPLNFDSHNLPRSQDLEPIYREASSIYVFKKETYQNYHYRVGTNPYIREIGYKESVDINDKNDFLLAEALVDKNL